MIQELTSTALIEQEFQQLQQELRQNLNLIEELTQIEDKFSQLEISYQDIRQFMPQATATLGFLQTQVNEGIVKLNAEKDAVHTSLQKLEEAQTKYLQDLQVTFEQEQQQLKNLYQQVRRSLEEIHQHNEMLTAASQHAQQQFQQATQILQNYQTTQSEFEQNLRNEFTSQQVAVEKKLRQQQSYITVLLLLLIGLGGYIATPVLMFLLN